MPNSMQIISPDGPGANGKTRNLFVYSEAGQVRTKNTAQSLVKSEVLSAFVKLTSSKNGCGSKIPLIISPYFLYIVNMGLLLFSMACFH